ncbi:hypothetical protein [Gordonia sp. 'Campus']|uniref:hypothetical protein n=1 Tax=Gordonia sp. 'Campus' TaxID=2915824 RepID=UPI001EE41494|nr:hypothetical protein [Gordonia sp. 'Campus']
MIRAQPYGHSHPLRIAYAAIRSNEDLGGLEMFPDRTDDLVGAQKEGPDPAATGVEASDPNPQQEDEGTL